MLSQLKMSLLSMLPQKLAQYWASRKYRKSLPKVVPQSPNLSSRLSHASFRSTTNSTISSSMTSTSFWIFAPIFNAQHDAKIVYDFWGKAPDHLLNMTYYFAHINWGCSRWARALRVRATAVIVINSFLLLYTIHSYIHMDAIKYYINVSLWVILCLVLNS